MSEDIIVTGRREPQEDGSYKINFYYGGTPGVRFYTPMEVSEDPQAPQPEVSVTIEKTKSETDQQKMIEAAQKLIVAVINVLLAMQQAGLGASVTVLNRTISISDLLAELLNTQFIVTDRTTFDNVGVGSAEYGGGNEPNVDHINFEAINAPPGEVGYGDPAYPDNSGMHALVLHELGHLNAIGKAFFDRSFDIFRDDPTMGSDFYQSEYATNVEAFANAIMNGVASQVGINLHGVMPGTTASPVNPETIYTGNTGQPYTG